MTWYILAVSDPAVPEFHWDAPEGHMGNPRFVVELGFIGLFGCVEARAMLKERYGGKELDWDETGARLTRDQILEFLTQFHIEEDGRHEKAVATANTLKPDKTYLLYAYES